MTKTKYVDGKKNWANRTPKTRMVVISPDIECSKMIITKLLL